MEMAEHEGGLTGAEAGGDEVVEEKARKPTSAAPECAKPNRAPLTTSDSSPSPQQFTRAQSLSFIKIDILQAHSNTRPCDRNIRQDTLQIPRLESTTNKPLPLLSLSPPNRHNARAAKPGLIVEETVAEWVLTPRDSKILRMASSSDGSLPAT